MKSVSVTLTSAFSYTGRYIGQELLRRKIPFQSLTNHLVSSQPPLGRVSFTNWFMQEGSSLCSRYIT